MIDTNDFARKAGISIGKLVRTADDLIQGISDDDGYSDFGSEDTSNVIDDTPVTSVDTSTIEKHVVPEPATKTRYVIRVLFADRSAAEYISDPGESKHDFIHALSKMIQKNVGKYRCEAFYHDNGDRSVIIDSMAFKVIAKTLIMDYDGKKPVDSFNKITKED